MRKWKPGQPVWVISFLVVLMCGPALSGQTTASTFGSGDERPDRSSATAVAQRSNAIGTFGLSAIAGASSVPADGSQDQPAGAAKTGGQEPSLADLGITPEQAKGSAAEQARLDRRSHMLKIHQRLGLITIAPLVATLIASNSAGEKHTGSGRAIHAGLGGATVGMYLTTASFAIFAPKVPHDNVRGGIKWHRRLAYVHGVGMVLIPILGAMAYHQIENGEKVHGIAQIHGPVAVVTTAAFGAAIASVSLKF